MRPSTGLREDGRLSGSWSARPSGEIVGFGPYDAEFELCIHQIVPARLLAHDPRAIRGRGISPRRRAEAAITKGHPALYRVPCYVNRVNTMNAVNGMNYMNRDNGTWALRGPNDASFFAFAQACEWLLRAP